MLTPAQAQKLLDDRFDGYKREKWRLDPLAPSAGLNARERMAVFRARIQAKEAASRG